MSTSTRADYTVIATWAVTPTKDLLLIDLVRRRFEAPDILPALRRAYEQHHPAQIGIERAGFQLALIQEARRAGLPIHELIPDADKLSRALPAAARMEGGQVAWPATAPWREALEAELLIFPNGAHDDQIDALAYAAAELARGTYGDVTVSIAQGMLPGRPFHAIASWTSRPATALPSTRPSPTADKTGPTRADDERSAVCVPFATSPEVVCQSRISGRHEIINPMLERSLDGGPAQP